MDNAQKHNLCINVPSSQTFKFLVHFLSWLFNDAAAMIGWLMNVEQLVKWELAGKTNVLREKLAQHHFVHCKSQTT
jgi:hypothetical protein